VFVQLHEDHPVKAAEMSRRGAGRNPSLEAFNREPSAHEIPVKFFFKSRLPDLFRAKKKRSSNKNPKTSATNPFPACDDLV